MSEIESHVERPSPVVEAGALSAAHLGALIEVEIDGRTVRAILDGIEHGYRVFGEIPRAKLTLITVPSGSHFYARDVPADALVRVVEESQGVRRRG